MNRPLTKSIVRVQCNNSTGSGFLIEGNFVLTAAHNITTGSLPQFLLCGSDNIFDIPIKVDEIQIFTKGEGDVALFRLRHPEDIPALQSRMLRLGNDNDCVGAVFQTFGFPNGKEKNGLEYNSATIDGKNSAHGTGFPQLTLSEPGNISSGYSGGPIYVENNGIVGLILEKGYELAVGVPISFIKKQISKYFVLLKPNKIPIPPKTPNLAVKTPFPDDFPTDLPATPYPGLKPFSRAEARIFFGRDRDITAIYQYINESPEPVTLLFGQSGVGKSSLLYAGLLPRLEDNWEVHYCRRDKDIGLSQQLKQFIQDNEPGIRPHLFILDQVEEMYTNPGKAGREEAECFVEDLSRNLRPGDKFILGFRSEYFAQIEDLLKYEAISFNEWFLKSLDKQGVLQAIREPARLFPELHIKKDLPETIASAVLENEASHIAPLLQIQMRKLYKAAIAIDDKQPRITENLYQEVWKNTLDELLGAQLNSLENQQWVNQGLALDLLHGFTTEQATATSLQAAELRAKYGHIKDFDTLIRNLKTLELLYHTNDLSGNNRTVATTDLRLTHDALAPLIRKRYHDSDAPAQRAWRLIESKHPDVEKGVAVRFDQYDIDIIEKGQPFMRAIPERTGTAIKKSKSVIAKRQAELRDKTAFIFDTLQGDAHTHIYQIEHENAIEKFRAAMDVDVPDDIKQKKLADDLQELIFFFAHADAPEKARKTLEIYQDLYQTQVDKSEQLTQGLQKCLREQWVEKQKFHTLLKEFNPAFFEKMTHRYFPKMIKINGGTFKMGGHTDSDASTIHEVQLDAFALAQTPTTFYQYGLYCASIDKEITPYSPPWGRHGDHPLVSIPWYDTIEYLNWLNEYQEGNSVYSINKDQKDKHNYSEYDYLKWKVKKLQNQGYCLPTEAQWEYAAIGGHLSKKDKKGIHIAAFEYAGSDNPEQVAWTKENAGGQTQSVIHMDKTANALDLHGMSGNVWEWCWDWYGQNYYESCEKQGKVINPTGPEESEKTLTEAGRVLRGGSWYHSSGVSGVAFRSRAHPDSRDDDMGFRVAQGY